jgi:hypothetical protein
LNNNYLKLLQRKGGGGRKGEEITAGLANKRDGKEI